MYSETVEDKLDLNNYRLTEQRAVILEIMMDNKGRHLSAEDVLKKAKEKLPNIGIATVYRTLEKLASIEVLYKTMFEGGKYLYELCDNRGHQHHHLVCIACGKILEVEEDLLHDLEQHIEERGFKIADHQLKFYGYCSECQAK